MSKKSKRDNKITKHHIIPESRGGKSNLENIAGVTRKNHRLYHQLFENKTPEEIIEHLVNHYWNGRWDYIMLSYNKYLGIDY